MECGYREPGDRQVRSLFLRRSRASANDPRRIHRFGQTKEVFVTRFLITPSIDDKMLALQERKTRVINGALGVSQSKDQKQLAEDLALIFAD